MTANDLRTAYINFFVAHGHREISSASLIPENDPTVLFTTAGMHPLVPYLLGEKHPQGTRLVNHQKCLRTGDIDEVGDDTHLTLFEMMGNWSLGDYFKAESIAMSHEFLIKTLQIPQEKISVTVFAGDEDAPRDEESAEIWASFGYPKERIYYFGKKENWWGPAGQTGPCGPDTEIFYDTGKERCGTECSPACGCGKHVEIWNNVFMQYFKDKDGNVTPLVSKNVDTGLGLERVVAVLSGKKSVFETEIFSATLALIEKCTGKRYEDHVRAFRIVADHVRSAVFLLGDDRGIAPSNVDQGYVLRRLIRRAYRYLSQLGAEKGTMLQIAEGVLTQYAEVYPELQRNRVFVLEQLQREEEAFSRTLEQGLKKALKLLDPQQEPGDSQKTLSAKEAFHLYDTYGFPLEFTEELAQERGISVDREGFARLFAAHQETSRQGAAQKFKGGLADHSDATTKLHTATHLLGAALRQVLGPGALQRGSNINPERLRFDFTFERKMTSEELAETERLVNTYIQAGAEILCEEMSVEEAKAQGAIGVFAAKYGERVKVYTMGTVSQEICGGPHAANTADLGGFKILQEGSSSAGVRRIKAVITTG